MSLLDMLTQSLSGDALQQISRKAGADPNATATAIAGALPVLVGALSRNASNPQGAAALDRAVARDHQGIDLSDLGSLIGGLDSSAGQGILKHVLGGRRSGVESAIGQMSGLDANSAGRVLEMLAPVVMAYLGKQRQEKGLDAGGLGQMLGHEAQRAPQGGFDLATRLLDADGDGEVMDDLAKIGGNLLGKFLGGR